MLNIIVHTAAEKELDTAVLYCRNISRAVANNFVASFERVIGRIAVFPTAFPEVDSRLRKANFPDFPYYLLFSIQEDSAKILLVRHYKQKIKKIDDRF